MSALPKGSDAGNHETVFDALAHKAAAELSTAHAERSVWTRCEEFVIGALALAALVLCSYNVFIRYFSPRLALEASDEVQVYLVVWAILLALGLVTAADRHVKADLFVGMFPPAFRRRVAVFSELLGLGFSLLLLWYGVAITWQAWSFGDVSTTSLRFPLWIFIAALPAGAFLMSVRYVLRLIQLLRTGSVK
ncbi:MAG: C4-dicarboxylate transporter, DctQ subunit [Burkholderiales bacterium]|jgi:TRAP-type C4-dicarboxylate transport system permease small subunit